VAAGFGGSFSTLGPLQLIAKTIGAPPSIRLTIRTSASTEDRW
jgi:hypothetical protein